MLPEPMPWASEERRAYADRVTTFLRERFGDRLIAVGAYGSFARGTDGPYSDLEMHAVVRAEREERYVAWTEGPFKASLDVFDPETFLRRAGTVEADWPMTASEYTDAKPTHDPSGFLEQAARRAADPPQAALEWALRDALLGHLYEYAGKARNARHAAYWRHVPCLAVEAALSGAWAVGLHHRRLYRSSATLLDECLGLGDLPAGLIPLLEAVARGDLAPVERTAALIEDCWLGAAAWYADRYGSLVRTLDEALEAELS